ncbi:MAG TPA: hypothetical protein VN345_20360 [Blastocatellia bacterium]|nr:hypothetical protein [Blastocatellia bacterium]
MMERIGIATIAPFPPRAPRVTYEEEIAYLASLNDDLIVLTAENRASIRNLPLVLGKRFIDVGICEQTLVGTAAGLALRGRTPIAHALAAFLILRAFEFVRTDVGIAGLPVKLVGGAPGFLSEANGPDPSSNRRRRTHALHTRHAYLLSGRRGRADTGLAGGY